jgi:hypothetical protein
MTGHDREVGPDFAQAKRVPFDPLHLFTATMPRDIEHRLGRLDPDQPVAAFGQLAAQQTSTASDVDDRRCRQSRGEFQIVRLVFGDRVHRIVDRDEPGIGELAKNRDVVRPIVLVIHRSKVYQPRPFSLPLFTEVPRRMFSEVVGLRFNLALTQRKRVVCRLPA